ncbi:MAG: M4 family metallopeptidase, partial [Ilumatobacteraceae bacterium]
GGDGGGEGDDAAGDAEVDGLYEHFGDYHSYLWDRFGRASYDDDGAPMVGTVRSPTATGNAYWDPVAEEMHYGEGYATLDVTAHELSHALISSTADLVYEGESGALNEAIADMFASNLDDNWTIGEDLPDGAIRDLSDPEAHGQPAHVDDFVDTDLDHGGVHTNSGIPNHAYYLMVEELGRDASEQILYRALTEHLTSTSGFEDFRTAALEAAEELYGADSVEHEGVDEAFAGVGLDGTWEAPS